MMADKSYPITGEQLSKGGTMRSLDKSKTMDDLVERDGLYYERFADVPFTGEITGQRQGTIKDGMKHGLYVGYHDNGQLSYKITYKDGMKHGPYVSYRENGQVWSKGTYKDGKLHGPYAYYHDSGRLWDKGTYKNGKKNGPWVSFHDNGQLEYKGTYKDGKELL